MTAQEWLDRADALAQAASDGPWRFRDTRTGQVNDSADAEFIAAARSMLPQAAAALRAVLDLHYADDKGECVECYGYQEWPCETVRDITWALT